MHAYDPSIRLRPRGILLAVLLFTTCGCGAQPGQATSTSKVTFDKVVCRALSFTPDGDHLFVGGSPKFIRSFEADLWNAETGTKVASIRHLGCERSQFSPGGELLVAGGWHGEITFWNANTGDKLKSVHGHRLPIRALSFSPNGQTIASASEDGLVKLWSVESFTELGTLKGHSESVSSLTFSSDSELLATGSADKTVRLWSTKTMKQIGEPIKQEWPVWFLAVSPDGKSLATVGSECGKEVGLKLWDIATRTVRKSLPGYNFALFSPDGGLCAVTTTTNATVVLIDVANGEEKSRINGNKATHYTLGFDPKIAFSRDGRTLAIGVQGISLVDVESGESRQLPIWTNDWIDSIAYSPDGTKLAVSPNVGKPGVVDLASGNHLFDLGSANASSLAFSPDSTRLTKSHYAGVEFGTIAVLNARTGKVESDLNGHLRPVTSLAVSQDGKLLASGSLDRTVRLWDLKTNDSVGVLSDHGATVYQVALAPDGAHIATASERLRIWNVKQQEVEKAFDDLDGLVYSVAYSPRGDLLVAGNSDGAVVVWETTDWNKTKEIKRDWPIRSLAFTPDGKTLAVAGGKIAHGIVELRNVSDLTLARSLEGHKGAVTCVSFSADGQAIVTCSIDKAVKRWTVGTGQIVSSLASFEMGVSAVAFSPSGTTVATGGFEGINLPGSK